MSEHIYRIPHTRMIEEQIIGRGIKDPLVIEAMKSVPRHLFVPAALVHSAYEDRPLPIGSGQTISQPYIVGLMSALLCAKPGMTVLEIGTGSGYQAAVLHAMGLCVFTVERVHELYFETKKRLEKLNMYSIRTHLSDGTLGWKEMAPFDRILVAAGGPTIPTALTDQLGDNGVLILPVGVEKRTQKLVKVIKIGNTLKTENLSSVSFVDLIGKQGW